jgi:hypothetical protein
MYKINKEQNEINFIKSGQDMEKRIKELISIG